MIEVPEEKSGLHIDVCTRCHMIWFDGGELDAMPQVATTPKTASPLSPEAREALAVGKVQMLREQAELENAYGSVSPDSAWKWIPGIFGLPVEYNDRSLSRLPMFTWVLSLSLFAAFVLAHFFPAIVDAVTFYPWDPYRLGGLTLVASMLVHADFVYLLGSLYFLLIFGDDVEEFLGAPRMALLLVMANIAGCLGHASVFGGATTPLLGFGAAVSGLIAFYSLLHPHAKIGLLFLRYYYKGGWLQVPAWAVFLIWVLWQMIAHSLGDDTHLGNSLVSLISGMLIGVAAWSAWRDQ